MPLLPLEHVLRCRARGPLGAGKDAVHFASIDEGEDHLVAAAQAGERQALESVLRSQHDRLYAVCRRLTGNDADAADATQDAMIAIVRGLPRFDRRSRFGTWTYRIAVNASLDELRRRRRRPEPGLEEDVRQAAGSGGGGRRAESADSSVERMDIDAALAKLSPEFRAAVVLRDLCGLDYAEISEVLGIPIGTVRSRIARGRTALVPLVTGNPETFAERPTEWP